MTDCPSWITGAMWGRDACAPVGYSRSVTILHQDDGLGDAITERCTITYVDDDGRYVWESIAGGDPVLWEFTSTEGLLSIARIRMELFIEASAEDAYQPEDEYWPEDEA